MSLSDKAIKVNQEGLTWFYYEKDVQAFIKELKEKFDPSMSRQHFEDKIDELAEAFGFIWGEKLK